MFVCEREDIPILKFMEHSLISPHKNNIFPIKEEISTTISSSKLRTLLSKQKSIKYFTPDSVVDYIAKNGLYSAL